MDEQNTQPVEPVAEVSPVDTVPATEVAPALQIAETPVEISTEISPVPEVAPEAGWGKSPVIPPTPPSQTPEPLVISLDASVEKTEAPVAEVIAPQASASGQVVTPAVAQQGLAKMFLEKALVAIQSRKQKKILKIMELFAKHETITNDDVEKLLHVSDSTATRYLSQLVKMGKVVQKGKTTDVVYAKL